MIIIYGLLAMTIKQLLGLFVIISLLVNNAYEKTNTKNNNDMVDVPIVVPEIIPEPKKPITFYPVEKYRSFNENSIYSDVLSHSKQKPYGDQYGRRINVHETSHGITSELRNYYERLWKKKLNVFYVLNSQCIILPESNILMSDIIEYIPNNLKSYRYNLYFVEQIKFWNDMPSYVLDEWNSYILSSMSAVDDFKKGLVKEKVDAVSGCLDFAIYSVCLSMAIKDKDINYWNNTEFKEVVKYMLIQSEKTFNEGINIDNFKTATQIKLYQELRTGEESKKVRDFLNQEFDGIFVK